MYSVHYLCRWERARKSGSRFMGEAVGLVGNIGESIFIRGFVGI